MVATTLHVRAPQFLKKSSVFDALGRRQLKGHGLDAVKAKYQISLVAQLVQGLSVINDFILKRSFGSDIAKFAYLPVPSSR